MAKKYDIAAYVWPAYTGDEPRTRMFWEEGIGEWQSVKNSKKKDNGYLWDRKPLWGYVNEANPDVMQMQIESALSHGVNVFIYDWYWYDERPFLENCLNDGFLKAPNCNKMKFYIMWANHDANYTWDIRNSGDVHSAIWKGQVSEEQFKIIGKRWIEQYFTKENYYKIDDKPVVSIYDMCNFVEGLGGIKKAKENMKWLNAEAKKYNLPGVHFQFVSWGKDVENFSGVDSNSTFDYSKLMDLMEFSSVTNYQFVHFTDMGRDYLDILEDVKKEYDKMNKDYNIPYFPHVSVGWDNNPRYKRFVEPITKNNTPDNFQKALMLAKEYSDKFNEVPLITINSWNEWTETSYLEPDTKNGYGYLEAIKKVFVDF